MAQPPTEQLAERQLRLLVEQMPAIVWTTDLDGRFTSVVGAGLESMGVQTGAVDIDMSVLFGTGEPAEASLAAHAAALTGKRSSYTASLNSRINECCVEPLYAGDRIVGSIGAMVDVTERRQAERDALFAYEEAVQCIVRAIELRDVGTDAHGERMADYCTLLAEAVGLPPESCHAIALASRLHDIGKLTVPDGILLKSSALTEEERRIMERHCEVGHAILASSQSKILALAATIALTHHEWWDGTGYPHGLDGPNIPLAGRIAAVADAFDALTSDRPYRPALSFDDAKAVMMQERDTHFDPTLVDLFLGSAALPRIFHRAA